jgi:hypothetical protein
MLHRLLLCVAGATLLFTGCSTQAPPEQAAAQPQIKVFSKSKPSDIDAGGLATPGEPVMQMSGSMSDDLVRDAAGVLGMDETSVRAEWSSKSLADVARARGIEPASLAEALAARQHERLLKDAAAGRIPAKDVDSMQQAFRIAVQRMIERPLPPGGENFDSKP